MKVSSKIVESPGEAREGTGVGVTSENDGLAVAVGDSIIGVTITGGDND
jgi:hypothetical protein